MKYNIFRLAFSRFHLSCQFGVFDAVTDGLKILRADGQAEKNQERKKTGGDKRAFHILRLSVPIISNGNYFNMKRINRKLRVNE